MGQPRRASATQTRLAWDHQRGPPPDGELHLDDLGHNVKLGYRQCSESEWTDEFGLTAQVHDQIDTKIGLHYLDKRHVGG